MRMSELNLPTVEFKTNLNFFLKVNDEQAPTLRDMCNKALILPLNNHFCEINFLKTNMRNILIVTG